MSELTKAGDAYKAAQERVRIAAADCAHWDYESHGDAGLSCCVEYEQALRARKAARQKWQAVMGRLEWNTAKRVPL